MRGGHGRGGCVRRCGAGGAGRLPGRLRRFWEQRSPLSRARKPGSAGQISCIVQSAVAQHMEPGQDLQKSSVPSVLENLIVYPSI